MYDGSTYKELYTVLTITYIIGLVIFYLAMLMIGKKDSLNSYIKVLETFIEAALWPVVLLLYLTINLLMTAKRNLEE